MGCFFAVLGIGASRLILLVLWLFTALDDRVFSTWIWPLLGVIFLPFTTLMYILVSAPLGSASIWGWLILGLAFLVDMAGWFQANATRESRARMAQSMGQFSNRNPT